MALVATPSRLELPRLEPVARGDSASFWCLHRRSIEERKALRAIDIVFGSTGGAIGALVLCAPIARPFIGWRGSLGDEDWVGLSGLQKDEDWPPTSHQPQVSRSSTRQEDRGASP